MHRDRLYNNETYAGNALARISGGVKNQAGWIVLIAGCVLFYFSLPIFPKILSLFTADDVESKNTKSYWVNTVNQKVNLPKLDGQGFAIPRNRSYFVITIPVGGCYSFEPIINASQKSRRLPFILILSSFLQKKDA